MMQPAPIAADGAARLRAVASAGSVLVQAPAGSGKTTLLAQRYLRLLAQVDAPERILALTFTRLAAQEMRERVVQALRAAAFAECPAQMNRETWALGVAARRHLQSLDIVLEREPSRLRVETIDSFNAWLAAQLPITSGAGGRLRLLKEPRPLYEEAARRAFAYEARDPFGTAVERVLEFADQRWPMLIERVADMLAGRDRWLPLLAGRLRAASALDAAQLELLRGHFDEDLSLLVTRTLRSAHEALGGETVAQVSTLLRDAARRLGEEAPALRDWQTGSIPLRPQAADLARWRALAGTFLTASGKLRKRPPRGFPPGCAERAPLQDVLAQFEREPARVEMLERLRGLPDAAYSDADWSRVREVAQVLILAAAELEQLFRERGSVDFPAVSMAAVRAMGSADAPTDLALRLDYRLQHLLLDEFQDTSSAQLELVRLLTAGWQRGDGRSVFCVGDPMQSIYGFRQAEVRAFLELAEEGIGDVEFEVLRLTSNFRADALLVEWVNRCFARIMPPRDDRERGAIAFRPSVGASRARTPEDPRVGVHSFVAPGREAEARALAELVESILREHPHWHIGILVRARLHAREIALALQARAVRFRAVELEPLEDRPAVRDLVMLIGALTHWGDRAAWFALLRAPWAALSLADLLVVGRAAPILWEALCDETVLERLSADGRQRCRRVRAVLEAAFRIKSHTTLTRWVERTWIALGGPGCALDTAELDDVRSVFARLRELEAAGPLPDAALLKRSFDGLFAAAGPPCAVDIMTIHKAKGLEFDAVIVPALERPSRVGAAQLLTIHEFARSGRDGMVMAARPPIGAGTNPLFEFLRREARRAADLEAQRLLYVACTRAKWQLHLSASLGAREEPEDAADAADVEEAVSDPGEAGEGGADEVQAARILDARWKPHPGSLLAVLWPALRPQFVAALSASPEPAMAAVASADATLRAATARAPTARGVTARAGTGRYADPLRRLPLDWRPPPLSSSPPLGVPAGAIPRVDTPVFDWAGETARRVGSLVHAQLQTLDLERHDESEIRARAAHFKRWLAQRGVPEERLEHASARAIAALVSVLGDPRGRWIFGAGRREDYREHALSAQLRGEVLRVVFDRTFIDERGIRWVIDYKTSHHAGGGVEEFLEREVLRYRTQLERYALLARKMGPEPVRVGLYFPLLCAWREWEPAGGSLGIDA